MQGVHPVLASNDVAKSVQFFQRLGFGEAFRDDPIEPKYAVMRRDNVELHVQWAASDQWSNTIDRPVYRFLVTDVDALYEEFVNAGCIDTESSDRSPWARPADTPWGTREFHIRDPGRNGLQFYRLAGGRHSWQ
jgi:Glyoxalase/Bleomycin resistance protein/Dioxygenase superfamily